MGVVKRQLMETGENLSTVEIVNGITELSFDIYDNNLYMGWWSEGDEDDMNILGTKLCLVHSEVSEAMEGLRKGLMDDHLPHKSMMEVEIADAIIRLLDLCGALEFDIGYTIAEKLEYNAQRADHKLENRAKEGGKKF